MRAKQQEKNSPLKRTVNMLNNLASQYTTHDDIYHVRVCSFFLAFFRSFPSTREHELAVWILRGAFFCLNTLSIRGDFHGR